MRQFWLTLLEMVGYIALVLALCWVLCIAFGCSRREGVEEVSIGKNRLTWTLKERVVE